MQVPSNLDDSVIYSTKYTSAKSRTQYQVHLVDLNPTMASMSTGQCGSLVHILFQDQEVA